MASGPARSRRASHQIGDDVWAGGHGRRTSTKRRKIKSMHCTIEKLQVCAGEHAAVGCFFVLCKRWRLASGQQRRLANYSMQRRAASHSSGGARARCAAPAMPVADCQQRRSRRHAVLGGWRVGRKATQPQAQTGRWQRVACSRCGCVSGAAAADGLEWVRISHSSARRTHWTALS